MTQKILVWALTTGSFVWAIIDAVVGMAMLPENVEKLWQKTHGGQPTVALALCINVGRYTGMGLSPGIAFNV
ncbi:hypothetical protein [Leisingera sp. ANG-Vp]|uniref:hypothetical protein n=1 Tax=Leisingera sp. ANG-Vp TaxID=1577896 RepID=UPI00126999FC|nr:hypothetical protein [Leisingera sp. ANG-Vp]